MDNANVNLLQKEATVPNVKKNYYEKTTIVNSNNGPIKEKSCKACNCDQTGSIDTECTNEKGKCSCKTGFQGDKCNQCDVNNAFGTHPNCKQCGCDITGSKGQDCSNTGVCTCKTDYEGSPKGFNNDKCKITKGFEKIEIWIAQPGPNDIKIRLHNGEKKDGDSCEPGLIDTDKNGWHTYTWNNIRGGCSNWWLSKNMLEVEPIEVSFTDQASIRGFKLTTKDGRVYGGDRKSVV